ncbi:MAG: single-stranded DNA-binding protein [Deltaproteobacteria bacterium]|nr:single-stranded DNA-binding protein [Deltaproteobacteria bacterium]
MYNKAVLIGRLGKETEVRYTPDGTMVTTFSIATDESWKDKSGSKQQKTTWHNIVCWGKLAEIAGNYLHKGSLVLIEGKIDNSSYDDKNGVKKYKSEIIASVMKMLGGDKKDGAGQQQSAAPQSAGSYQAAPEDDVPF